MWTRIWCVRPVSRVQRRSAARSHPSRYSITIIGDPQHKLVICQRFTGNNSGKEPPKSGTGPDSHCQYQESDITYK